jgi:hypothetical protein
MPEQAILICLTKNLDIPINAVYTEFDFVTGTNGTLSSPLGLTVTQNGTQLCASVPAFTYAILVPILKLQNYIAFASTTTVPTVAPNYVAPISSTTTVPTVAPNYVARISSTTTVPAGSVTTKSPNYVVPSPSASTVKSSSSAVVYASPKRYTITLI